MFDLNDLIVLTTLLDKLRSNLYISFGLSHLKPESLVDTEKPIIILTVTYKELVRVCIVFDPHIAYACYFQGFLNTTHIIGSNKPKYTL